MRPQLPADNGNNWGPYSIVKVLGAGAAFTAHPAYHPDSTYFNSVGMVGHPNF